ncbi:hypothetical protein CVS40_4330 [Lucilia cuprina]|nr:hypothetical protein CVS40_4330 [Lucilia cuprina]
MVCHQFIISHHLLKHIHHMYLCMVCLLCITCHIRHQHNQLNMGTTHVYTQHNPQIIPNTFSIRPPTLHGPPPPHMTHHQQYSSTPPPPPGSQ